MTGDIVREEFVWVPIATRLWRPDKISYLTDAISSLRESGQMFGRLLESCKQRGVHTS
jgi:hypothetical protein